MRFITNLNRETIKLLIRISKQSQYYRVRQRAHCILLSYEGYTTTQLMTIFRISRVTIYNWFNNWEKQKLVGLYDAKGKGRKPKLKEKQKEQVLQWAKTFPKSIKKIAGLILEHFSISLSKKTIKRILKYFGFTWRRIRQRVAGKPDPLEYQQKKETLQQFKRQDEQGIIDLRYFDESGFCLTPYIPYAWQVKNETIEIETQKSERLNVVGFLNRDNNLTAYTFYGNIDSQVVIACIDDFTKDLKKKTVLVIDNARIHTSDTLKDKMPEWKEKGLELFYLPTYSPELNVIEILWRFIKYEWIQFRAYKSFQHLVQYVENVIKTFGNEYQINFV